MPELDQSSILDSTKAALGLDPDYKTFDPDILMHINSAFSTLNRIGAGPKGGFRVLSSGSKWEEFYQGRTELYEVQSYVYLRVRLLFDPPTMGYLVTAIKEQIKEHEFSIQIMANNPDINWQAEDPMFPDLEARIDAFMDEYVQENPIVEGHIHKQIAPLSTWTFSHPLGREPMVQVYIDGELILADVVTTSSTVTIQFPAPAAGIAVLS